MFFLLRFLFYFEICVPGVSVGLASCSLMSFTCYWFLMCGRTCVSCSHVCPAALWYNESASSLSVCPSARHRMYPLSTLACFLDSKDCAWNSTLFSPLPKQVSALWSLDLRFLPVRDFLFFSPTWLLLLRPRLGRIPVLTVRNTLRLSRSKWIDGKVALVTLEAQCHSWGRELVPPAGGFYTVLTEGRDTGRVSVKSGFTSLSSAS